VNEKGLRSGRCSNVVRTEKGDASPKVEDAFGARKFGEAGACNGTLDLDLTLATIRQAQPGATTLEMLVGRPPVVGFWKVAGRYIEEVEAPIMTRVATRAVLAV
jgi:hypothetical protein